MKKSRVGILSFLLLFLIFGTKLAAEGMDYYDSGYSYFDTVNIVDTPCYVVPDVVYDKVVSDDTIFFLPAGIYDGYEATLGLLADLCKTRTGLPKNAVDGINDILYDIYLNDDYVSACLNDAAARRVDILWERATYYWGEEDEDKLKTIYDCLPDWAGEMYDAAWQILCFLGDVYDLENGNSYCDDYDELVEYYKDDDDFVAALDFINIYYPKLDFNIF